VQKCTFDIGKPNASGWDINAWMPGQNTYRETHTADYMTDYQARRLNTRVKRNEGGTDFVYTNDATAFALGRIMIARPWGNPDVRQDRSALMIAQRVA
jgi:seryl-tRNA synthetase